MDHKRRDNKEEGYRRKLKWAKDLFGRYFEGTLDEATRREVEEWDPEEVPEKYELTEEMVDEGTRRLTESLYSRLGFDPDEAETREFRRLHPARWRRYAAAAVILGFIMLGAGYLFTLHDGQPQLAAVTGKTQTILFADGSILTTLLPDGTSIHINNGSTVRYNEQEFNKEKREIWLEGEAFFDVAKNPDKQFIIHSENLSTVVKGTSFNVKAYRELAEMTVSVRTGKVEVRGADGGILAELTRNQQLLYSKFDGQSRQVPSDWQDAAAWMQGRLLLKDAPIDELLLRIRQLYGVKVSLPDGILKDQRVTVAFGEGTGFGQVMDAVCVLYDVQYRETGPGEGIITGHE